MRTVSSGETGQDSDAEFETAPQILLDYFQRKFGTADVCVEHDGQTARVLAVVDDSGLLPIVEITDLLSQPTEGTTAQ